LESNRKYISNLTSSRGLSNGIFILQIELLNVLKSWFKYQSRLGSAHHWLLVARSIPRRTAT